MVRSHVDRDTPHFRNCRYGIAAAADYSAKLNPINSSEAAATSGSPHGCCSTILDRIVTMRNYRRHSRPFLLAFPLLIVSTPAVLAAAMDVGLAMPNSAVARVWFLRPTSSADGNVWGAAPLIYANGVPVAAIPPDAAFYRDVAPGTYRFAVEPYGVPT